MDQPTTDRPTPEEAPAPEPIPATSPLPHSKRDERVAIRLHSLVDGAPVVVWTRGWVSREVPAHRLLAARTLDFAVLTDNDLILFSSGFFTRRPRRLVYSARLDHVRVVDYDVPRGRRLRIKSGRLHPLRIELPATDRATAFADALVGSVRSRRQ